MIFEGIDDLHVFDGILRNLYIFLRVITMLISIAAVHLYVP